MYPMYNNGVLVGNWSEERLKIEYDFKIFLRKRDRKELLLQKSRTLFSNLLMERPLSMSGMFVMFGYNVQVVASDMRSPRKLNRKSIGLALSGLVTCRQVDYVQNLCDGCLMTLSPITTPCCRNTFFIVSTKDESIQDKVTFGDEFLLRAVNYGDPHAPPLYVRFNPEGSPGSKDTMPLRLSTTKDTNCRFTTSPLFSKDRLELLGSPIRTNERILIKNCVADLNLAVMNREWFQTFFGLECGVNFKNYMDIHKKATAENIFMLISDVDTKSQGEG